jgi:hypothetical protein
MNLYSIIRIRGLESGAFFAVKLGVNRSIAPLFKL